MLVTGQKLASEQIKIQLFLVLCWYLETGQEIHQLKKIQWNNHKGKSKYLFIYLFIYLFYLFIYLLFFLGMAFLFFLIQN